MKIRTRPLLGAAMVGVILLIIYYLIVGVASYQVTSHMLDTGLFDPETLNDPDAFESELDDPFAFLFGVSETQFAIASSLVGLASCVLWLGAGIGTGAAYTILHNREETVLETPVKGGAAAGALAYVLGTLGGSLISMLFFLPFMNEMFSLFNTLPQQSGGPPPGFPAQFMLFWVVSFVVSLVCSTLFWGGMGAALGALGSALGKAVLGNR